MRICARRYEWFADRFGADNPRALMALGWLAHCAFTAGGAEALAPWRDAMVEAGRLIAAQDRQLETGTLEAVNSMAWYLALAGEPDAAAPFARSAVERFRLRCERLGESPGAPMLHALDTLAVIEHGCGRPGEARRTFEELCVLQDEHGVLLPAEYAQSLVRYGELLLDLDVPREAYDQLQRASVELPPEWRRRRVEALVRASQALGSPADAERWRAELGGLERKQ
jgi:hypothetical protein